MIPDIRFPALGGGQVLPQGGGVRRSRRGLKKFRPHSWGEPCSLETVLKKTPTTWVFQERFGERTKLLFTIILLGLYVNANRQTYILFWLGWLQVMLSVDRMYIDLFHTPYRPHYTRSG